MFKSIFKRQVKDKTVAQLKNSIDNNHYIYLSELECGKYARITKFENNTILIDKLNAMGIFSGTIILKKSALPAKGSIIIERGTMQFALGYNIAEKILVERL